MILIQLVFIPIQFQLTVLAVTLVVTAVHSADYVHNPIHYHSQAESGAYNYGYDTGLFGAHQFHQETKNADGTVNGRYGYTDPDGKLRLVYYIAGPGIGYNVVKDIYADKDTVLNEIRKKQPAPKPIPSSSPIEVLARKWRSPIRSHTFF